MARTLIYDIETAPIVGTTWGKYEQNLIWSIQDWYMLCFAYKWLGERKTYIVSQTDFKDYKPGSSDDKKVIQKLWELFNEADIIVAHNGNSFDAKKARARMIYHGFTPPAPYKQIDTKLVARRYFSFTSNKLDDLGEHLKVGRKLPTGGYELWRDCMNGDKKAWKKMMTYNKQDVILLEKIYVKLRPWMENHPSISVMDGRPKSCNNCGSERMHRHTKKTFSKTGWKMQYKCYDCGAYRIGTKLFKFAEKLE